MKVYRDMFNVSFAITTPGETYVDEKGATKESRPGVRIKTARGIIDLSALASLAFAHLVMQDEEFQKAMIQCRNVEKAQLDAL